MPPKKKAPKKPKCKEGTTCGVGPKMQWWVREADERVFFKDARAPKGRTKEERSFIPGVAGSSERIESKLSNPVPMQNREHKNLASSESYAKGSLGRGKNGEPRSYARYHK